MTWYTNLFHFLTSNRLTRKIAFEIVFHNYLKNNKILLRQCKYCRNVEKSFIDNGFHLGLTLLDLHSSNSLRIVDSHFNQTKHLMHLPA